MSDVYRYEFDENGVCYRKPDGPFVSHDDYAALHYERIHDLNQIGGLQEENARLKAEVERLKAVSTIEQRTIQGLQQTPEWSEIARLTAECRRLEAENNRLRASSFVTAVPVEQYERLVKAGDAMAKVIDADATAWFERVVRDWKAAKEGKPSA